ncbi:TIGR04211 family SH3 domain-containing protein [Kushneria aurantia]|uniref:TIGR04211 family SH3 domain-containing protein n=1 Tax=Kushneria aurantia TaxID=504092 RepID=A0ABV6G3L6_9GAMM|nr:TIGR04211 family SH3 domain-containing protein [Kushneria aurantia]
MKILVKIGVGLLLGAGVSAACAEESRWISDDLSTWVRSGPTDSYRIVGTVNAGDPVTLLESQNDYSRIRTEDGETVWIPNGDLQSERSVQARMPALRTRVEELTGRLENIDEEWNQRVADMRQTLESNRQRVSTLQDNNEALNQQLGEAQSQLREYQAQLDTEREDLLMRYFLYGGGVAGAGLLLGLIVPHLPRRRKKRDRWF